MITNPCRGLLKTIKVNKDPWGTLGELLVSSIAVGLQRWTQGGTGCGTGTGAAAAPEKIQVQGVLVQKIPVPWCCRWHRDPGAVSSSGQPSQSQLRKAELGPVRWTGAKGTLRSSQQDRLLINEEFLGRGCISFLPIFPQQAWRFLVLAENSLKSLYRESLWGVQPQLDSFEESGFAGNKHTVPAAFTYSKASRTKKKKPWAAYKVLPFCLIVVSSFMLPGKRKTVLVF